MSNLDVGIIYGAAGGFIAGGKRFLDVHNATAASARQQWKIYLAQFVKS